MKWFDIQYADGTWFMSPESSILDIHFKENNNVTIFYIGGGNTDCIKDRQEFIRELNSNNKIINFKKEK